MIKACDKTLKMQSWKTVFLVLSLILYFSHGANQTINDVQFHSLKTVEASDKDEGKTNKDIVVRELAKETAQWVLDKNKHNLIIETTPSKSQNNAGIYIEETDKAKGYFKLSSKKEAINKESIHQANQTMKEIHLNIQKQINDTGKNYEETDKNKVILDLSKNKEVVKKISQEGTEIKNQTTNETQSKQTLTVNKPDKHKMHLLNKYKDVVKQTRRKDEIFVKVLGQKMKTKRKQSVNNSRNYNREINTNQSIPQLFHNKIDDEIAPLQIINEFRKENGNIGVLDQPYDSKEVVGKAPNKKNINRNQITQNHLKIPVKHRQDYGSIVNLGKHNDQPNGGSLEMITKLNNFVKEYGNDAGNPNKNKLKESKVENKIRNSNITHDYEDTKFKALKKDLIASIMNKTSMLVIKLINDRYPSDQEKARVLHIIKEKVLSKVSPLSERYLLWTEVISKGVDATFEKIRLLSGKAYRRQYNHEMKVSISEPVVRPQLNIPFKQLSSSHPIKCEVLTQKACTKIITLNTLICESGNGSVTMEKLCDGIYDCEDGSDEVKCSDKATNKLKQAERIVEEAESSKFLDCFKYDESYLGRKKSESLMKVIARQISLIAHCIDSPLVKASINGETRDRRILEQASNQIATVISSVSLSLDGAICTELVHSADDYDSIMQRVDEHEEDIVKVIDEDDIGEQWMFRSCKCFGKACLVYPCDEHCKKICDHKHNLGRIMCRSFSRDTTISLDLICDGKIDCEDESDEKDCNEGNAYARFEGFNAFGRVGQLIQNKIHSKYYSPVRGKLFKLQNSVTQLQKLNANLEVDKSTIKSARNKAFELLGSIYVDMLTKVSTFNETEQIFVFLMSLHNELIGALKHSHTGNKRIVPTEDCSCRGTTCNIPFCPLYCVKACSVEPSFTQLACKKQPTVKVDLNHICDGTRDCPLGDDEKLCDKDMCRKHNFLLLRTRLNKEFRTDLGQNLLGEILKTWKKKAIQTVKTAEVAVIANRENYKLIVKKILHDLVMAYSFTDDIKGNPRQLYNTFYNVSQQVIKLVNYCGTY